MALRGRSVALALALVCLLGPGSARAATITVDTELDFPVAGPMQCSLRSALAASGSDAPKDGCPAGTSGHDTIVLRAGLYGLNGALVVGGDVTIAGAGSTATILSQSAGDRVLSIPFHSPGYAVTLDGLTVTGGHAPDGSGGPDVLKLMAPAGIDGEGASGGNGMSGGDGGGVNNAGPGTLTVLNARIAGNSSGDGGNGGRGRGEAGGFANAMGTSGVGGIGIGGPAGFGGSGGGIASLGPVVVRDSVLTGNLAGDGGNGGVGDGGSGGDAASNLQGRRGGEGRGGFGGSGGSGGAIYASGAVTVERSLLSGNHTGAGGAGGEGHGGQGGGGGSPAGTGGEGGLGTGGDGGLGGSGGAIRAGGGLTISASTVSGNATGVGGAGGGARGGRGGFGSNNSGNGWFGGNATGGAGGSGGDGAGYQGAILDVTGSLFFDNHAGNGAQGGLGEGGEGGGAGFTSGHGGTGGNGSGGPGGRGGHGGAAAATAAGSQIADTTVTQNGGGSGGAGGGGKGGKGGNSPSLTMQGGFGGSGAGADGGSAGAGGIAVPSGNLAVTHATISANAAGSGGAGGTGTAGQGGTGSTTGGAGTSSNGSAGATAPGGLHNLAGPLSLANSIVASNTPTNCAGGITDGGNNIRFGESSCPGSALDPKLGALADNGGPTRTQRLGDGSAALDFVPSSGAGCTAADQRGVTRPGGGACDAGAYERAAPVVATGDASAVSGTGATVAGTVTPNAGSATYRFDYGTTGAYGSSTGDQALGGGVSATGVTSQLGGLAPNTTYHYRLVATTADGSAAGADRTFTTARDGTPPRFLSASIRPRRFAVNRRGTSEKPVAAVARGTTFRFALSEDARVVFTIHRVLPGRRVGRRCVKPTARNRSKRACKRYVKPRRFATRAKAGANRKRFSGRIGRRALAPGSYRATLVARDEAGNASAARRLSFRVVRAR